MYSLHIPLSVSRLKFLLITGNDRPTGPFKLGFITTSGFCHERRWRSLSWATSEIPTFEEPPLRCWWGEQIDPGGAGQGETAGIQGRTKPRASLILHASEQLRASQSLRAPVVLSGWVRVPFGAFLSFYGVIKTAIGRPNQKSAEKCNTCLLVGVQINKKT